jgi:hypothetical protein
MRKSCPDFRLGQVPRSEDSVHVDAEYRAVTVKSEQGSGALPLFKE